MQLGGRGPPALSPGVDRSRRLPDQAGLRTVGRRNRRPVTGPQLVCVPADPFGGMSQILRVDLDRSGTGSLSASWQSTLPALQRGLPHQFAHAS